jgi:prophage antirepressor-like protein
MMKEIQIFEHPEFGNVRVMEIDSKVYFVGSDVAKALGYKNPAEAVITHCKSGNIANICDAYIPHSNGIGGTNVTMISESNVYRLIMRSNLPAAEKFQDWVCEVVLPSIRKTGNYSVRVVKTEEQKIESDAEKAKLFVRMAEIHSIQTYKEILLAYAVEALTGKLLLPGVTEETYSATDIGLKLNLSSNMIGKISNALGLKSAGSSKGEYGEWFVDKARHSSKEVETFRYNSKGFDAITEEVNRNRDRYYKK